MKEGFRLTDLGELPESWTVLKIGALSKVITGNTPSTSVKEFYGGEYPWVTPTDINENKCIIQTTRTLTEKGLNECRILPANSILVTCIASIGKNAILKNTGSCNQQINAILPSDNFSSDFIYYYLEYDKKRFFQLSGSTAVPIINKSTFETFKVPFPPLPEQEKIAEILSTVDEKIDVVEAQIQQTTELKKGLVQQLLTKGIGHTQFKNSPLGEIPESWKIKRIGDFADVTAGGTPSTSVKEFWNGNIPWMNSGEIKLRRVRAVEGRITELGLNSSSTKIIPINSILIALAGQGKTRGKVAINEISLCTNQSLASIFNLKEVNHEFLFQNLESRYTELRRMSTGEGGRGGLNLAIIKSILLALPPIAEQLKIANGLKTIDDKIEALQQKNSQFIHLKKALMQQLLTGKMRVNQLIQNEIAV